MKLQAREKSFELIATADGLELPNGRVVLRFTDGRTREEVLAKIAIADSMHAVREMRGANDSQYFVASMYPCEDELNTLADHFWDMVEHGEYIIQNLGNANVNLEDEIAAIPIMFDELFEYVDAFMLCVCATDPTLC